MYVLKTFFVDDTLKKVKEFDVSSPIIMRMSVKQKSMSH